MNACGLSQVPEAKNRVKGPRLRFPRTIIELNGGKKPGHKARNERLCSGKFVRFPKSVGSFFL